MYLAIPIPLHLSRTLNGAGSTHTEARSNGISKHSTRSTSWHRSLNSTPGSCPQPGTKIKENVGTRSNHGVPNIKLTPLEGEVELEKDGTKFTDWCNVLINGSGPINKWKCKIPAGVAKAQSQEPYYYLGPLIEGIGTYKGELVHSANWNPDIDWKGKRVAVIGSGSSSIQIVPQVAEGRISAISVVTDSVTNRAKRSGSQFLAVFARNQAWIAPQMGSQDVKILPDDSDKATKPAAAGKHQFTEEEKEKLRTDPEAFLKYRKEVDGALQKTFSVFLRGSELNIAAKKGMAEMIHGRIGPGHEDLKEKFVPKWSPGCRRMTVITSHDVSLDLANGFCSQGKDTWKHSPKNVSVPSKSTKKIGVSAS